MQDRQHDRKGDQGEYHEYSGSHRGSPPRLQEAILRFDHASYRAGATFLAGVDRGKFAAGGEFGGNRRISRPYLFSARLTGGVPQRNSFKEQPPIMAVLSGESIGLESFGIGPVGKASRNLVAAALYEESIRRGEGLAAVAGPLVVLTGKHTGRSP